MIVAVNVVKKVGQIASNLAAVSPSLNTNLRIALTLANITASPWGQALQLYRKEKSSESGTLGGEITVYCVQCGVTGKIHLSGEASWTLANGLRQANMGMDVNLRAGLQIGVDAQAELKEFLFPIIQRGMETVPPVLSVSGLFTVGPEISLSASIDLGITLSDQVLAGFKMSIPAFAANVDLVDGFKSSMKGFTPQFEKIFEAKAQISATAGLGLPVSLGLGINIPPIKFRKMVSLTEKPVIEANLKYTASTTCQGIGDDEYVDGIGYEINCKLGNARLLKSVQPV